MCISDLNPRKNVYSKAFFSVQFSPRPQYIQQIGSALHLAGGCKDEGRKTASFGISPEIWHAVAYGAEREQSLVERQQCAAVRHLKRVSTYVSTVEYHYKWVIPVKRGECPKPHPLPSPGAAAGKTFRGMCVYQTVGLLTPIISGSPSEFIYICYGGSC